MPRPTPCLDGACGALDCPRCSFGYCEEAAIVTEGEQVITRLRKLLHDVEWGLRRVNTGDEFGARAIAAMDEIGVECEALAEVVRVASAIEGRRAA